MIATTVLPLENFAGHAHWDMVRWIPFYDHPIAPIDIIANIALFVPFGYLLMRALLFHIVRHTSLFILLFAAAISTGVEVYQVYCHNRIPSTTDIITNILGAICGLTLHQMRRGSMVIDRNGHIR
jgi:glycopeptide antibiotics resistance protein